MAFKPTIEINSPLHEQDMRWNNGDIAILETGRDCVQGFELPISRRLAGRARARRIRELLAWALTHEIDERLKYYDGSHVHEPHPEMKGEAHPDIVMMQAEADALDDSFGVSVSFALSKGND